VKKRVKNLPFIGGIAADVKNNWRVKQKKLALAY
jgi:hypothetical protein